MLKIIVKRRKDGRILTLSFAFLFIIINEDVITTSTPSPIEQTEAKENAYYDFWGLE